MPFRGIRQVAPLVHFMTQLIDEGRGVVSMLVRRKTLSLVEHQSQLLGCGLDLLGFGNRRDVLGRASLLDDTLGGLSLRIEFPVTGWFLVRRVEDGLLEKIVGHGGINPLRDTERCIE
ncbi:hypothetical protein D3C72_2078550 [compost metagenome]